MPTRNVNLTDHLDSFIDSGINSGRFSSASEVVREGLRLLEQREAEDQAKLTWLRTAAQDSFAALNRGEGVEFHSMDDLADFIEQSSDELAPEPGVAEPTGVQRVRLAPAAREDIRDVLRWSLDKFGFDAAARYRALLMQALRDLEADPLRPGSRARPELHESARTYHMALSRDRVEGQRVKTPRHFMLYRIRSTGLEIGRILHDSRELARHLPEDYRTS